jgi:hypothetical protein
VPDAGSHFCSRYKVTQYVSNTNGHRAIQYFYATETWLQKRTRTSAIFQTSFMWDLRSQNVNIKITTFSAVMSCDLVDGNFLLWNSSHLFSSLKAFLLPLLTFKVQRLLLLRPLPQFLPPIPFISTSFPCAAYSCILETEAAGSSETSVNNLPKYTVSRPLKPYPEYKTSFLASLRRSR